MQFGMCRSVTVNDMMLPFHIQHMLRYLACTVYSICNTFSSHLRTFTFTYATLQRFLCYDMDISQTMMYIYICRMCSVKLCDVHDIVLNIHM